MRRSAGPPRRRYERPSATAVRAGLALGHPRPAGIAIDPPQTTEAEPLATTGLGSDLVERRDALDAAELYRAYRELAVRRLRPEESIELKLRNQRYRVGGSAISPRIECLSSNGTWLPLGPGEKAEEVLLALRAMQWRPRQ